MLKNLFKRKDKNIDKEAIMAGKLLVDEMLQEKLEEKKPVNIQIDFFATKKEKELKEFLIGFAEKHFLSPKSSKYCAIKFENGFIYEIQENGDEKGFLSDVLKKINNKEKVIIELADKRKVKISKEGSKIKTISLTENDSSQPTLLEKKDKMNSLYTPNLFLLFFGLSLTVLGLISMVAALSIKHIIIDEKVKIEYKEKKYITPYEASLSEEMIVTDFEKINTMEYTENKGWKYNKVPYEDK